MIIMLSVIPKGQKMKAKYPLKDYPNFYELALLLAYGQSRNSESRWESFIDNLSRICDEFASQIHPKEKPWYVLLKKSQPYPYRI